MFVPTQVDSYVFAFPIGGIGRIGLYWFIGNP